MDFAGDAEAARAAINAQVAEDTNDHVTDLLPAESLNQGTKFVAVNALYFSGKWETAFHAGDTADQPFIRIDGSTVSVPMMNGTIPAGYACREDACLVELPYRGDQLVLDVLLPDAVDGLPALEDALAADPSLLDPWFSDAERRQDVLVAMPRLDLSTDSDLVAPLVDLGAPSAFDPRTADFSGISPDALADPDGRLHLSVFVHSAWVHVDESGTQAAAATAAVGGDDTAAGPPSVLVDHPYLFFVRDRVTGAILFLGRVADPS
jgi:serpin B